MHDAITRSGRYGVNVLCADQEHVSGHFAELPHRQGAPRSHDPDYAAVGKELGESGRPPVACGLDRRRQRRRLPC